VTWQTMMDSLSLEVLLDEMRAYGWMVAVHNDYRLNGRPMTFWLFTHPERGIYLKAEGESDLKALYDIVSARRAQETNR